MKEEEKGRGRYESRDFDFKYFIEVFLSLEEGCETGVRPWERSVTQIFLVIERA